jgi:hypothetical protein
MFESAGRATAGSSGPAAADPAATVLAALDTAVTAVLDQHPDELDEAELRRELAALETTRRRLHARVCTVTSTLTSRQARRARDAHPNDPRQAERAARETQQALAGELGWTPSEAKDHRAVGEQLRRSPATAEAMHAGAMTPGHARHLERTLRSLSGEERRTAERRLLAAAQQEDVVTFGRTCQALLAELDGAAAARAEERRHQRRRANLGWTPDGMLKLYGEWGGIDAEALETVVSAFRRPDATDEHRSPEQRTADAVADWARAALAGDRAPTQHGTRPHVVMTIAAEDLRDPDGDGTVTFGSGRQTLLRSVRRYLDDAKWSWIVVDEEGAPLEAGPETTHVPVALWRALVQRDGGCIADGCDARPEWCDAMHLGEWRKDGGRLTLDSAGLGCRFHHRKYDLADWRVTWEARRPILHHPDRPPRAGPDRGG